MNAKTLAAVIEHGEALKLAFRLGAAVDPVGLCRKLRRLEREAGAVALRLCNGPAYRSEEQADAITDAILGKVDALLGFKAQDVPVFVNRDPRGYALKIDDTWMMERRDLRLHRDWGGYGIIAPDLTDAE